VTENIAGEAHADFSNLSMEKYESRSRRYVADRLDAVLNDAARTEPTYLDFLDG
jgi:hypothetical protein